MVTAAAVPANAWGTWEELILGGAVVRHGTRDWNVVASELRVRTLHPHSFFTPERCKAKFEDLQKRYADSTGLFEELKKQRVAELKRELAKSEDSIGSLESKIKSLKAERRTESPRPVLNSDDNRKSVCKETSKDEKTSADLRTTTACLPARRDVEAYAKPDVSKQGKEFSLENGVVASYATVRRKQRSQRKRKICHQTVKEGIDAEIDKAEPCNDLSTEKREDDNKRLVKNDNITSSNGTSNEKTKDRNPKAKRKIDNKKDSNPTIKTKIDNRKDSNPAVKRKIDNSRCSGSELKTKRIKGDIRESDNILSSKDVPIPKRKSRNQDNIRPCNIPSIEDGSIEESDIVDPSNGASTAPKATAKEPAVRDIFKSIASSEAATVFRHRMDSQKRARYRRVVKQHLDMDTVRSKIAGKSIASVKELFRDLLLLANNALVFYSRRTREYKSAFALRNLVMEEYRQHCSMESCKEASSPPFLPPFNAPVKPRSARPRPRPCLRPESGEWAARKLKETPCESETSEVNSLVNVKKGVKRVGEVKVKTDLLPVGTHHKIVHSRQRKRFRN
ncbi:uncharacterized protein LOC127249822 [Andrographis paniculata]|uniref:uncharacterized protein LOC127249822 n=1 Tax=Andrographis paniculata TaxID=175694 RepID=UPI0021E808A4|nr:uncharacterized protein LOC127249822 [Andrographis paniculata]XP_051128794.1 uncharacterized protein LOC127249822 [Andrographis paniculata]